MPVSYSSLNTIRGLTTSLGAEGRRHLFSWIQATQRVAANRRHIEFASTRRRLGLLRKGWWSKRRTLGDYAVRRMVKIEDDEYVKECRRKIGGAHLEAAERMMALAALLSCEDFYACLNICEREFLFTSALVGERHRSKLRRLCKQQNIRINFLSRAKIEECVTNESGVRNFSDTELELLALGPRFNLPDLTIRHTDFVEPLEVGIRTDQALRMVRLSLAGRSNAVIQGCRDTTAGLRKYKEAATKLKKRKIDREVVIQEADKGGATVIMSTCDYIDKIGQQLNDQNVYKRLPKKGKGSNPAFTARKELNAALNPYIGDTFSKREFEKLVPTLESVNEPGIYGKPKLHKEGMPLRIITPICGTLLEAASKYLEEILSPYTKGLDTVATDSFSFVKQVWDLQINWEEHTMASLDVVALYPSIPHDTIFEGIKKILSEDEELKWSNNRHGFSLETISDLLKIVVKHNFVAFEGERYRQVRGVPMGSPVSVSIANLITYLLEKEALKSCACDSLVYYTRYVDDIFLVLKKGSLDLQQLLSNFNAINPAIQFTLEQEDSNKLPFLDVLLTKSGSSIETEVYHKPTAVNRCLHFRSHHPKGIFKGIVMGAFTRARRLCNTEGGYQKENNRIFRMYRSFGYPAKLIKRSKWEVEHPRGERKPKWNPKRTISIPYNAAFETLRRIYAGKDIKLVAKATNTVGKQAFNMAKNKRDRLQRNLVVYRYLCTCGKAYIGQTKRSLKTRIAEHRRSVTNGKKVTCELANHLLTHKHTFSEDYFTIIDSAATPYRTWLREGYHIQKGGGNVINMPENRLTETWFS